LFPLFAQSRIVSTSPAITETLFALGLGARVVGVSEYCHFPAVALTKPKIGSYLRPNVEAIVRLRPDLVIVERLPNNALEQLIASGIPVSQVVTGNLAANLQLMRDVAKAANAEAQGKALVRKTQLALDAVAAETRSAPKRGVVFIVGRVPGKLEGMIAVGRGSYLNELMSIAGGRNLLGASPLAYPKVSLESIIRLRPEVILDMGEMAATVGVTDRHKQSVVQLWKSRPEISSRVHAIADDIFVVPGPRMADAAREFHRLIHGGNDR